MMMKNAWRRTQRCKLTTASQIHSHTTHVFAAASSPFTTNNNHRLFNSLSLQDDFDRLVSGDNTSSVPFNYGEFTGMRVVFLGTSAMKPTSSRNVTSIALQMDRDLWLFDCGEGTQLQLMKSGLGLVDSVFITHLHGDHIMGLPGIVMHCLRSRSSSEPMRIFGPAGTKRFLTTALTTTKQFRANNLQIQELLPRGFSYNSYDPNTIYPDDSNIYHVFSDDKVTVKAKLIQHSVPTFGYVVEEHSIPGSIDAEKCMSLGLPPGKEYKLLKKGIDVNLPDGRVIKAKDVVGDTIMGRKVVILGDTCDASSMIDIAYGANVLIHETTLPDEYRDLAYSRGHASPSIAGKLAKDIDAQYLYITHFGGACCTNPSLIRNVMVPQAQSAFGKTSVIPAHDFMAVNVPRYKRQFGSPQNLEAQ